MCLSEEGQAAPTNEAFKITLSLLHLLHLIIGGMRRGGERLVSGPLVYVCDMISSDMKASWIRFKACYSPLRLRADFVPRGFELNNTGRVWIPVSSCQTPGSSHRRYLAPTTPGCPSHTGSNRLQRSVGSAEAWRPAGCCAF